jgi:hypothetical protein
MTYSELLTNVAKWMNRDDLTAIIPDFVLLTEERINRALRVRQMEVTLAATPIVSNQIALASDIVDAKLLWVLAGCPLKAQSLESVTANGATGTPSLYALSGGNLVFDGAGTVQGVLYQRIPALATSLSNWLSVAAPSLYLFGAMAEAKLYVGDEAGAQSWDARFQGALDELAGNDNRLQGPLVARAR